MNYFNENKDFIIANNAFDIKQIAKDVITKRVDDSIDNFYVLHVDDIIQKHRNLMELMPRIKPFFAVKCNDHDVVLQTLIDLGTGFDCASREEIRKVLSFGVAPERIIFANPTKPKSHIQYAKANNVKLMTFDNENELKKIRQIFPEASLVLRIATGSVFGCEPVNQAPELLKIARKMNLNVVGISFHIGQYCTDFQVYESTIKLIRDLYDFAQKLEFKVQLIDIGGGLSGNSDTCIKGASEIINKALALYFPCDEIEIISEPGRYYVASSMTLVAEIQSKRNVHENGNSDRIVYYISAGFYSAFMANARDFEIPASVPLLVNDATRGLAKCVFRGPTCCAKDEICESDMLQELEIGDWVMFRDKGGYTLTFGFSFNGFPQAPVYCYIGSDSLMYLKHLNN